MRAREVIVFDVSKEWTPSEKAAADALRGPLQAFFGVMIAPVALRAWARIALDASRRPSEAAEEA